MFTQSSMNLRRCSVTLAIVLIAVVYAPASHANSPEREFGKEANPEKVFKETGGRSSMKSKGMEVRTLRGRKAGKLVPSLQGAKSVSRRDWQKMEKIPKTGLYLVDLDYVPAGLEDDLKKKGYKLTRGGTLTRDGNPVALFVVGETFRMKLARDAGPPARKDGGREGTTSRGSQLLGWLISAVDLASDVEAASPFPWRCGSWSFSWEYDGGFCREYRAWSRAYAWGPGADGYCASPKPLTHIQYISTYVSNSGRTDWDYHFNASMSHSYAKWDIGCFWPAHGSGSGFHYAYWRDGSAWMYRTWSW